MVGVLISPKQYDSYFGREEILTPYLSKKYYAFLAEHEKGETVSFSEFKEMFDV